jgi:hypothetical protein
MSRESILIAAITNDPATTSELYDRVGYPALARLGLIPYKAFRDALVQLAASGTIEPGAAPDGSTTWRRPDPSGDSEGPIVG